jgi:hypothetical protein
MCCPLDHVDGSLIVHHIYKGEENGIYSFHIDGIYDRTPSSLSARIFRTFQRLELIEKIAEVMDESFHLLGSTLQAYASTPVYQIFRNLHHISHDVEHHLHAICFLADVSRIATGKFFEYHDKKRTHIDYMRTAARICHAIAHSFATAAFLSDNKICQIGRFSHVIPYAPLFSAMGYAVWTITLLWRKQQKGEDAQFNSNLAINIGGFLFEALPLFQLSLLSQAATLAGIIHAWSVVNRLMPKDQEPVSAQFKDSNAIQTAHCNHSHHPHKH